MADKTNLAPIADSYGALKLQIDELEGKLRDMRLEIISCGYDAIAGDMYLVTVSKHVKETLSVAAAEAKLRELNVAPQWFVSHTKKTDVSTVRVKPRAQAAA